MGYTISAELPNQKEQETLLILLKKIIDSEHFNSHAYISRDHSEHGHSVKLEHGIYISFSILDHAELLFLHSTMYYQRQQIALTHLFTMMMKK